MSLLEARSIAEVREAVEVVIERCDGAGERLPPLRFNSRELIRAVSVAGWELSARGWSLAACERPRGASAGRGNERPREGRTATPRGR